ncbi:SUKH-3 domain-containing protein [Natronoglycomyces albus]|uniref:SUKH-3 domain-containing protein n=1 Tax=Natronoglycomyces albus TaxID=2811108 RepID=A0A895XS33_9ACTN|nr:SUKH-3 domain-containing protein [Natronoglycomyces albus]QSB05070.1 SUKH-3 domain-containing protein [Natronoglycomyces albus]
MTIGYVGVLNALTERISLGKSMFDVRKCSPQVLGQLEKAGWYPGRQADLEQLLDNLRRDLYGSLPDNSISFLESLWGLSVEPFVNVECGFPDEDEFLIDPPSASEGGLGEQWVKDDIGGEWFPIGCALETFSVFVEVNRELVCAQYNNMYFHLGGSLQEALEFLILRNKRIRPVDAYPGFKPWPPPVELYT